MFFLLLSIVTGISSPHATLTGVFGENMRLPLTAILVTLAASLSSDLGLMIRSLTTVALLFLFLAMLANIVVYLSYRRILLFHLRLFLFFFSLEYEHTLVSDF